MRLGVGFLFIFLFLPIGIKGDEVPKVKILLTTGQVKDGYPVMIEHSQNQAVNKLLKQSFMKHSLHLYQEALKYTDTQEDTFYLSFKKGSGCYGRIGFYLMSGNQLIDMRSSAYIELDEDMLTDNPGHLQSITQIFAHEMGHILLGCTTKKYRNPQSYSFDMHYSNVITEYSTAFNEGFAEHFEIIARKYEPNKQIKNQIVEDMKIKKKKVSAILPRVKRDFNLPLRLNFYRGMSLIWLDQQEAIKRDELVLKGMCIYKNDYQKFNDIEKTLLYRNMGLGQDLKNKRSLTQALSTESVVSRFFVLLEEENKLDLKNHYDKIFKVFHSYITEEGSSLIEFINGYIKEYPDEEQVLHKVFKSATGYEFTEQIAPEIWLVHEGDHITTPIDSFGGVAIPVYTFNLNTCEIEDLLKLEIKKEEAQKIIGFREEKEYFLSVSEVRNIEDIENSTVDLINHAALDNWMQEKFDLLFSEVMQNMNFDMGSIVMAFLIYLIKRGIALLGIFIILYSIIILRTRKLIIKDVIIQMIKFMLYLILGLVCSAISMIIIVRNTIVHPVALFVIMILIIEGIRLFLLYKDRAKFKESFISTFMLTLMLMYSLF